MSLWTKDQTSELISLYKKFPNLYNAKHENFRDRRKREESFNKIREKICVVRKNTTIKDIKVKIKTIRNQYYKEKNLIKKSTNRDDKIIDIHQPKLWFYFEIRFIDPENNADITDISDSSNDPFNLEYTDWQMDDNHYNSTLNEESLNNENIVEESLKYEILTNENLNDPISNDEDNEPTNLPNTNKSQVNAKNSKTKDLLEENCRKSLELSQQMARTFQTLNRQHSHLYFFMKSIETDLLALPNNLQHEAKWKIQDIVRQAQKEHLENLDDTSKKNNVKTYNNEIILQKETNNIPVLKHSNIKIQENTKSISALKKGCPTINTSTAQIGKPKIYKVLKPIPKHNSSSNFPLEKISSTLILGEKSILDTAIEVLEDE